MNKLLPEDKNKSFVLVLDVGTTGVKAFVFDNNFDVISRVYKPLRKNSPQKDWVEQDPLELLSASRDALRQAGEECGLPEHSFIGFGLTNQRETTILWDKSTGETVYPAIVWEDKRTSGECLKWQGLFGKTVRDKTGLPIDPYFSASKIWWILRNSRKAQELLKQNNLVFGTVDTWILWNFLEGNPHLTDYSNASRTLLFNIRTLEWDEELLDIFEVNRGIVPQVKSSRSNFGNLKKDILGFSLPVLAVCGDQQAGLYGAGREVGTTKATFGTGAFVMQIIGPHFSLQDGFFTTLTANQEQPSYALEAKLEFNGSMVEDALRDPKALNELLTKLVKIVDTCLKQLPIKPGSLIIDGGVARREELAPMQSKISRIPVYNQKIFDGTALGVAELLFTN